MEIAFGILGQTTMHLHGSLRADWGPPKLQKVLAALLVQPGMRISVPTLVEWVWSVDEQEPNDPASTFRTYAGRIGRKIREAGVPATLRTIDGALRLDVQRDAIDYFAFAEMVKNAREHSKQENHEEAFASITAALALWRDHPLADLTSQRARNWRHSAVHDTWLPANRLLLGELAALGRFETALQKLDELQREHRTDVGLARRRLHVLRELGSLDDMGAYHLAVRKLLLAAGDEGAAENLLAYYNTLDPRSNRPAAPGARGAAERLSAMPRPRPPADRSSPGRPPSLLPVPPRRERRWLPPAPPDFVGHHDLRRVLDDLARTPDGRFRPGVIVLDGLAGIGKTALALHWAHQQCGTLVDTALYLDLHGFDGGPRTEAGEVVDELLDGLDVPISRFGTRTRREAKLSEILGGSPTLVILDNAANSAHVLPLWPTLSGCLVLVTSRQGMSALASRYRARHCSVMPLNEEHAAAVLTGRFRAPADAERASLARLTALCGGFPLALQLVAHRIEGLRGAALARLADELRDRSRLLDIGDDGDEPPTTMRATLSVTYTALPPGAQDLFRLIGLSPAPELTLPAAVALSARPVKDVQRALDVLVSTHFLSRTSTYDRFRVHDLLRAFAGELAEADLPAAEREAAERRLSSYYLHTSYNADRLLFPFRTSVPMLPVEPEIRPLEFDSENDAAEWLLGERVNLVKIVPWAARRGHHDYAWRIPHNFYGLYRNHGFYGDVRESLQIAVSSAQVVGDLESEAATRSDLGLIYLTLGEWNTALQEFHLAAVLAQKTRSVMGMVVSLSHLGVYEARTGNLEGAAELYRKALDQVADTGSAGTESAILHRLAETFHARGRCDEALALYRKALIHREAIGNRHGQAETLIEMSAVLRDQCRYGEALAYG
jgi:tetratricopeptide (TPR) repeat protein